MIIYSLASPRRTDPKDDSTYRACLKPIGAVYKNKTLDTDKKEVKDITIEPASDDEIYQTEKVMGGEDWELWTDALLGANLLSSEISVDEEKRIRLDDWEMDPEVQQKIIEIWPHVNTGNLSELTDFDIYQKEFLKLFGFGRNDVDYEAEVDPAATI